MRLNVADAEVIGQDNDNVWRTLRSGEGIIAGKARYGEEEGNKEVHHAAVQHSWAKEDAQAALVGKPPSERSNSGLIPVTGEHRPFPGKVQEAQPPDGLFDDNFA
jgi:hypothetical protein